MAHTIYRTLCPSLAFHTIGYFLSAIPTHSDAPPLNFQVQGTGPRAGVGLGAAAEGAVVPGEGAAQWGHRLTSVGSVVVLMAF